MGIRVVFRLGIDDVPFIVEDEFKFRQTEHQHSGAETTGSDDASQFVGAS